MADLKTSLAQVLGHEGGWVDDPADSGGETYRGVSRKWHPSWPGWAVIDAAKPLRRGQIVPGADAHIERFYREEFWNRIGGDLIRSQVIADELMDTAINASPILAVEHLQLTLTVLGHGPAGHDIAIDGDFGPRTLAALTRAIEAGEQAYVVKGLNVLQGEHYVRLAQRRVKDRRFIRGWFARVTFR